VAFALWEARTASPLLDVSLFRKNRVFALSNLAALIHYSATFAVGFLLSLYLQYIKGFTPDGAGTVLVAQPAVMALLSPFAGRLSDVIEPRVVASLGMGMTAAGLLMLTFLVPDTSLGLILAALLLLGLGFALFSSPNTNAVMGAVEKRYYGVASGILGTMRLVGQMLSMGLVMLIFALYLGKAHIRPANYHLFLAGVRTAFAVFGVLCALGVFASLARGNVR
jgi:MFS family permease